MSNTKPFTSTNADLAIIGGGRAGLAFAKILLERKALIQNLSIKFLLGNGSLAFGSHGEPYDCYGTILGSEDLFRTYEAAAELKIIEAGFMQLSDAQKSGDSIRESIVMPGCVALGVQYDSNNESFRIRCRAQNEDEKIILTRRMYVAIGHALKTYLWNDPPVISGSEGLRNSLFKKLSSQKNSADELLPFNTRRMKALADLFMEYPVLENQYDQQVFRIGLVGNGASMMEILKIFLDQLEQRTSASGSFQYFIYGKPNLRLEFVIFASDRIEQRPDYTVLRDEIISFLAERIKVDVSSDDKESTQKKSLDHHIEMAKARLDNLNDTGQLRIIRKYFDWQGSVLLERGVIQPAVKEANAEKSRNDQSIVGLSNSPLLSVLIDCAPYTYISASDYGVYNHQSHKNERSLLLEELVEQELLQWSEGYPPLLGVSEAYRSRLAVGGAGFTESKNWYLGTWTRQAEQALHSLFP